MTLKFEDQINSFKELFKNVTNIIEIDLSNFDSSQVTTMEKMFYGCWHLEKINFKNINTSSVEIMKGLFQDCSSLISIDISNFDTTKSYFYGKYAWRLFTIEIIRFIKFLYSKFKRYV